MKTLTEELLSAQNGDTLAIESILTKFSPLMHKKSWQTGKYDEDCYQECSIALYLAIFKFKIRG